MNNIKKSIKHNIFATKLLLFTLYNDESMRFEDFNIRHFLKLIIKNKIINPQKTIDKLNEIRMDMNEILVDRDATIVELEAELKKIKYQYNIKNRRKNEQKHINN